MALPQSEFGLSDAELKDIALIHLNWASAEAILGHLLQSALAIPSDAAKLLVHSLDGKKKADLLWKIRNDTPSLKNSAALIGEARYAFEKYRGERNIYSHGLILSGDDGSRVATSLKGEESNIDNIPLALEKSRFAILVAARLAATIYGGPTFPEMPTRPA